MQSVAMNPRLSIALCLAALLAGAFVSRADAADVHVDAIVVKPASPVPAALCELKVRLKNSGSRSASYFRFKVKIDGQDVRDLALASLRALIGTVAQDTFLFNDTVERNIAYGRPDVPAEQIRRAAETALAHEFIERLPEGYQTVIGDRGAKLSGGQRQRLAIARALLKNAPILILDEATSHLDTESEMLVQKALANLMEHRTVIVIAHRLSTIRRADKIVVLEKGCIRETGTHEELMGQGGIYQRLHELQFEDAGTVVGM